MTEQLDIDAVIAQLLKGLYLLWVISKLITLSLVSVVRKSQPGTCVQLTEPEVRGLCLVSRDIFLSQPMLLELEVPLKICGEKH